MQQITPFSFFSPGDIRFGRGQAGQTAELALGFGARVVLVHGASAARAEWLIDDLKKHGAQVRAVACAGEPSLPMLETALASLRVEPPELVIALGGGSVIDLGKALAALLPGTADPLDHLEIVGRGLALEHNPLPFIALPTTAGTGAEVTKNAVISVPGRDLKVSLRDARMIPDIAIVDPALTDGAPRSVTLSTGLDAITQVIEPYVCTRANPMTDALCRAAIPIGLRALVQLMQEETTQARDAMAWVSLCGGLALANSGLGAVHGLAGVIGGVTGAPHGAICGTLLPHVLDANIAASSPKPKSQEKLIWVMGELAVAFDAYGSGPATRRLKHWAKTCGLPSLTKLGVTPEDRADIAKAARVASSMKANPVPLSEAALVSILEAAA